MQLALWRACTPSVSRNGGYVFGAQRQGIDTARKTGTARPGDYFRTGNAATKFRRADNYVVRRLRRLMFAKRGRNLRAGQAAAWTEDLFNGHGLHRFCGFAAGALVNGVLIGIAGLTSS